MKHLLLVKNYGAWKCGPGEAIVQIFEDGKPIAARHIDAYYADRPMAYVYKVGDCVDFEMVNESMPVRVNLYGKAVEGVPFTDGSHAHTDRGIITEIVEPYAQRGGKVTPGEAAIFLFAVMVVLAFLGGSQ